MVPAAWCDEGLGAVLPLGPPFMLSAQGVLVPCLPHGVPGRDASLVVLSPGPRCRWSSAVAVPLVAVGMREDLPRAAWRQVGHVM